MKTVLPITTVLFINSRQHHRFLQKIYFLAFGILLSLCLSIPNMALAGECEFAACQVRTRLAKQYNEAAYAGRMTILQRVKVIVPGAHVIYKVELGPDIRVPAMPASKDFLLRTSSVEYVAGFHNHQKNTAHKVGQQFDIHFESPTRGAKTWPRSSIDKPIVIADRPSAWLQVGDFDKLLGMAGVGAGFSIFLQILPIEDWGGEVKLAQQAKLRAFQTEQYKRLQFKLTSLDNPQKPERLMVAGTELDAYVKQLTPGRHALEVVGIPDGFLLVDMVKEGHGSSQVRLSSNNNKTEFFIYDRGLEAFVFELQPAL